MELKPIKINLSLFQQIDPEDVNPSTIIELAKQLLSGSYNQSEIYTFLDDCHHSSVAQLFTNESLREDWFHLLVALIRKSDFHLGKMIFQRIQTYGDKPLLQYVEKNRLRTLSYTQSWEQICHISKAIDALSNHPIVIGIFSPNQVKTALVDLACLSTHVMVVPLPVNLTQEDLSYTLNHSGITHLFISGESAAQKWNAICTEHHSVEIITISQKEQFIHTKYHWDDFLDLVPYPDPIRTMDELKKINVDEPVTILYTSGTTDHPKGVSFSHVNMVSKRFARALALPEIGNNDDFLCYLPLFHTFGRFFELMGAIFWGATYTFCASPAFNSVLQGFRLAKPSVLISIPKRWVQIYDMIEAQRESKALDDIAIKNLLLDITGGNLKWGLAGAGYLDPDIFLFFIEKGIHLMSGYGMTEASGGISMTPPNDYAEDSLGKPLPGMEMALAEDKELLLRSEYISVGYFGEESKDLLVDGWFPTGDIFEKRNGHFFIVDRKKDIYKNSRGQTIAPQKIENLFQDFESIQSIFLVGDGKSFNTVLIYPDFKNTVFNFETADKTEIQNYYSSLILSVNSFLSSFERIVNFAIIDRDFNKESGEITNKNTFNRKIVLEHFSDVISPMYRKNHITLYDENNEIQIPIWFLRELGIPKTHISWDGKALFTQSDQKYLSFQWEGNQLQIGDFSYEIETEFFDFQAFIKSPHLWLGNESLVTFCGDLLFRVKEFDPYQDIKIVANSSLFETNATSPSEMDKGLPALKEFHLFMVHFLKGDKTCFDALKAMVDHAEPQWQQLIRETCIQFFKHPLPKFRIDLLESLLPLLSGDMFFQLFQDAFYAFRKMNPHKGFSLPLRRMKETHHKSIIHGLNQTRNRLNELDDLGKGFIQTLLLIVSEFGIQHPTGFSWARAELSWWQIADVPSAIKSTAQKSHFALIKGFRSWLGFVSKVSVDSNTGLEYSWEDVLDFDENVRDKHRIHLLRTLSDTTLLREALFLFSNHCLIQLDDIILKGLWVTHLGTRHGKSVFRVLVRTRTLGIHNFVINVNEQLDRRFLENETQWLILMGTAYKGDKLVEDFGGYWPEFNIYTEEYIPGETLNQYLERNRKEIQRKEAEDRWQMRWLHFMWNGIYTYLEFWSRSNYTLNIQNPSPNNLIIPEHDYSRGRRLISISDRQDETSIATLFSNLYQQFILATESKFPGLKRMADWEIIFTCMLRVATVKKGLIMLEDFANTLKKKPFKSSFQNLDCDSNRVLKFIQETKELGVLTKPVVFASLRFERWLELNPDATRNARSAILEELYQDYHLDTLIEDYPETRVRFFMMTCFKSASDKLQQSFIEIIQDLRQNKIDQISIAKRIQFIKSEIDLSKDDEFFLAKILYKNLDAADYVEMVAYDMGETEKLDLVIQVEDNAQQLYRVRPPFKPKEIAKYHSLLLEADLNAVFHANHEFLLIFDKQNKLAGGIFWKNLTSKHVHIEWVLIKQSLRKQGLSQKLMDQLFNRLNVRGIDHATVGFFHEKFFYKMGFQIDPEFGGLVKYINI
jgi:long-subunit acyl-CoA synthetase (AMP-forming)/GNAT superfamily N-acetyltransferase